MYIAPAIFAAQNTAFPSNQLEDMQPSTGENSEKDSKLDTIGGTLKAIAVVTVMQNGLLIALHGKQQRVSHSFPIPSHSRAAILIICMKRESCQV
jgi:hypothetical protein